MTSSNLVETLQPATKTVDVEILLNQIEKYIIDHAILPEGASTALALWCVATYFINIFHIFPKLTITSPEKRCGKSTVLDLIEAFSSKSIITSNMTPASIYRVIEEYQPTLIIDEADTFLAGKNGDIVGIINSGHAKNRAFVSRCVGDDHRVMKFSTWTPMALASIGALQSTIMDRSVVIQLRRKTQTEIVKRIPYNLHDAAKKERCKLLKWAKDNEQAIKANPIEPPELGNDRAVDNWLPLFSIAKQVSPAWLKKCNAAYVLLNNFEEEPQISTLLLSDIRDIFHKHSGDKFASMDLVDKLTASKDKPWCEIRNGGPMSQNGLALMLKIYGIKPSVIRHNGGTIRGYELDQFTDAFDRYLEPQTVTV